MKDIKKLANILNADVILIDIATKQVNYLDESTNNSNKNVVNLLIDNIELLTNHIYQSLDYNSGHILTCHVNEESIVCFSFKYDDPLSTSGADVKIMDRFFRHRELPDSENFSKPGFQLKTA
ncbi:hypothetical protein ACI78P_07175 [Leuconostoc mesenteroides]|uniref:hypothetical protein n=1 Tax=Leuconostoc mesenteroides TaxID=1245 RepID=UPI0038586581